MQNLSGVDRVAARAVDNLVTAARAWGHDERVWVGLPHGGKEHEFPNPHRDIEVLLLVAERTGHPATAAGDHGHLMIPRDREDRRRMFDGGECLLMAVAMQEDPPRRVVERIRADVS